MAAALNRDRRGLLRWPIAGAGLGVFATAARAQSPADEATRAWDGLLRRHVAWNAAGTASRVDYRAFAADRAALGRVLEGFSAIGRGAYDGMSRDARLSFLINAYNAFTVELILTRWPDLKSIKDLGSFVQSPWKKKFFRLLGEERTLDNVEHDMIRAPGAFDEPRIHFVVNCASIGCPALRPEAVTADRLAAALADSTTRFLRDRNRNRFNAARGRLEVSKIFDWYGGDFGKGHQGITSLPAFFGTHADLLADDAAARQLIRDGKASISFLDYDWSLNDRT